MNGHIHIILPTSHLPKTTSKPILQKQRTFFTLGGWGEKCMYSGMMVISVHATNTKDYILFSQKGFSKDCFSKALGTSNVAVTVHKELFPVDE